MTAKTTGVQSSSFRSLVGSRRVAKAVVLLAAFLAVLFITWTVTLSRSVAKRQNEIGMNVGLIGQLGAVEESLRRLDDVLPREAIAQEHALMLESWPRLMEEHRAKMMSIDRTIPDTDWLELHLARIDKSVQNAHAQVQILAGNVETSLASESRRRLRDGLREAMEESRMAVGRVRSSQRIISEQLAVNWDQMYALAVVSCGLAATVILLLGLQQRDYFSRLSAEEVVRELNKDLTRQVDERTEALKTAIHDLARENEENLKGQMLLQESQRRLEQAQNVAMLGSWASRPETTRSITWSREVYRIFGLDESEFNGTVDSFFEMVHPDDREQVRQADEAARRTNSPYAIDHRIVRKDGSIRWVHERAEIIRDGSGKVVEMLGTVQDITDRKLAENRQAFLMRELDHRVKNILAAVTSLMEQTAVSSENLSEFRCAFRDRIGAMARTHEVLALKRWEGVAMKELAQQTLGPHLSGGDERIMFDGPEVQLSAAVASPLCMAMNELATNAVKYGALSCPTGHVRLGWAMEPQRLVITWVEFGGPPVTPPARRGLGTVLIEGEIAYDLRGRVSIEFPPDGVRCTMYVPMKV